VTWTIKESNLFAPGGSVSAQVESAPSGGSRIHLTWNRTGVGFKGRMLVGIVKLRGGKPVAASINKDLEKQLTGWHHGGEKKGKDSIKVGGSG
jgi:hypothetical protein